MCFVDHGGISKELCFTKTFSISHYVRDRIPVDSARIGLATDRCERSGIPLTYEPVK